MNTEADNYTVNKIYPFVYESREKYKGCERMEKPKVPIDDDLVKLDRKKIGLSNPSLVPLCIVFSVLYMIPIAVTIIFNR